MTEREHAENSRIEFGDFQTPQNLASEVVDRLLSDLPPVSLLIEPTCGVGGFLLAASTGFPSARIQGYEINEDYVREARALLAGNCLDAAVEARDFFSVNWRDILSSHDGFALFLGNPPWVTNSAIGTIRGANLPRKANIHGHRGLDAQTGKSNFDISEWMLIQLLHAIEGRKAALAFLVKTAVARKLFLYAVGNLLRTGHYEIRQIDAKKHFGVSVDAVLFVCRGTANNEDAEMLVFPDLAASTPSCVLGCRDGRLISSPAKFDLLRRYFTVDPFVWRSGLKHDLGSVLELSSGPDGFTNGVGEKVRIEPDYVFPLLKSSDIGGKNTRDQKWVIVTQRRMGEETEAIREQAPETWKYLLEHEERFNARKSSIYKKAQRFAIFGIGDYSFAPWKVAISSLYKTIRFRVLGPRDGKPIMVDDTCYLFPCQTKEQAVALCSLLESKQATELLACLSFSDSKRVVTKDILGCLNLEALSRELKIGMEYDWRNPMAPCRGSKASPQLKPPPMRELDLFEGLAVREGGAEWK